MVKFVQLLGRYKMIISYAQQEAGLELYVFESIFKTLRIGWEQAESRKMEKCDIAVPFYSLPMWDYGHGDKVTLLLEVWKEMITWE